MINKSSTFISLLEADFEYRQLDDLLNIIRKFDPGEYDTSGVESIMVTSKAKANIDDIQNFITRYHNVCYIILEGYSADAKDLILMSDEPKKIGVAKTVKDNGAFVYKNRLFANNLE
jgi:hypothetical protein